MKARKIIRPAHLRPYQMLALSSLCFLHTTQAVPVDLELSLIVDASGSIDSAEWSLMMAGYAKAFRNPSLIAAATSGLQRSIAVNVLQFSGSSVQVIPWTKIDSTASSQALAARFETLNRQVPNNTGTDISRAIDVSLSTFASNDYESPVQVMAIAGDGEDNQGAGPAASKNAALAVGIDAIHGIVVGDAVGGGVENHYRTQVIAGESPLLCTAVTFDEFSDAILFKLSRIIQQTTGACPILPTSILFDQHTYRIDEGATVSGSILIDPVPLGGLFSQGFNLTVRDLSGTIAGFITPSASTQLNFDGVRLQPGAKRAPGAGLSWLKGSASFADLSRPTEISSRIAGFSVASLPPGSYTLELAPRNDLGPTESIFVTGCCQSLDAALTFQPAFIEVKSSDPLAGLQILPASDLELDRQTGLIRQTLQIRNSGTAEVARYRIFIGGLPADTSLWNRTGLLAGLPYVDILQALSPGATAAITLEYYRPSRDISFSPSATLAQTTAVSPNPNPDGIIDLSLRVVGISGKGVLVEFASEAGRGYSLEYSDDMTTWHVSRPAIQGNGTKVQWIDSGLPKTTSFPAANRFYRITRLPN